MARLPCKNYFKKELAPIHSVKSGIFQSAFSTSPRVDAYLGKSALVRIARLKNSLAKGLKRMVTKCSGYTEKYTTIGLRSSGYGAAEVFIDFAEELKHTEANSMCSFTKKSSYVMLTFETKIIRLE